MGRTRGVNENKLLAALSHPLRRRILRRMREIEAISPQQMAKEFELPLSNVAYHVRVLAACGAVTIARVKPARGSLKHFYRSSLEPPWAQQIIDLEPWPNDGSGETPGAPET